MLVFSSLPLTSPHLPSPPLLATDSPPRPSPRALKTVNGADDNGGGGDARHRAAKNAPGAGLIAMVKAEQGGDTDGMWAPLPGAPEDDLPAKGNTGGGSWAFEGKMDEEAEHAAFRKAIEELRGGRGAPAKEEVRSAEQNSSEGKENVVVVGFGQSESSP